MSVDASATLSAAGSLLLGGALNWPNIRSDIDLVRISVSSSSWMPTFSLAFKVSGKLGLTLNPGFSLSIGIALDILDGTFKKGVYLFDQPSLVLQAPYKTSLDRRGGPWCRWASKHQPTKLSHGAGQESHDKVVTYSLSTA